MSGSQWLTRPDLQQMRTIGKGLLLIASISSIVWVSTDRFLRVQDSHDEIDLTMRLDQQVSQLRSQYLDANPEALEADLEQADQLLIQNFTHLAQWAQGLQEQGDRWNLQMHYRILTSEQTPAHIEGLTVIPMEIQVASHGTRSAYRPYLQFLQTLEHSGPRVDIQEVTVRGDGQKATHLTVGLSLWMKTTDSVEL